MKSKTVKINNKDYTCQYPDGLEHEIDNQLEEIFKKEVYKLGLRKKDSIFIDLGANVGNTSRYFYDYAKEIYSIEANPNIYGALVENTKELPKVKTFNYAISATEGMDYMYSNKGGTVPQTFWGDEESVYSVQVNLMPIHKFMKDNSINHVDVLKIDVEGSEYLILPSTSFAKVADKIDFIIGESHYLNNGGFPQVIPEILKEYGFKTEFIDVGFENYIRTFTYMEDNIRKSYRVPENTMFIAYR